MNKTAQNIKVGVASLNQVPLDWPGNILRVQQAISEAKRAGVRLLCLPELCLSGYGAEDAFFFAGVERKAKEELVTLLPQTSGITVCLGLPLSYDGNLHNAVAVVCDGQLLGFVLKQFLADYGLHYETRWFKAWKAGDVVQVKLGDREFPAGDLVFDFQGLRLGFEICHDAWVEQRPLKSLAKRGVQLVANPSASHFAFSKYSFVRNLVKESSANFDCDYLYANLLGNEAGRVIYDGASFIASSGEILAEADRFSFKELNLQVATLKARLAEKKDCRGLVKAEFSVYSEDAEPVSSLLKTKQLSKYQEFTAAVCLGLYDYLRKSGAKGYVVSLSGGADSSSAVVLIRYMVELAARSQGMKRVQLEIFGEDLGIKDTTDLTRALLCAVYQATSSSSSTTRNAARAVALESGAEFLELELDEIVESYKKIVSEALEWQPDWTKDSISLQNIQARTRAPSVWLIANLRASILLATSNRSEAAVGYTTMDGDTCGGLSPIGGIDKAFLRDWLRWVEREGPSNLFPIKSLAQVNAQEPTAELRPGGGQRDEEDLMPYEVLDIIERFAIRDRLTPLEVFEKLIASDLAKQRKWKNRQLGLWVKKFFSLWCQNQWKRERYAPSFHLDDQNLDPKTWCRFPILSGGFKFELQQLTKIIESL